MNRILLFIAITCSAVAMQKPQKIYDKLKTEALQKLLADYVNNKIVMIPEAQIRQLVIEGANPNIEHGNFRWLSAVGHFGLRGRRSLMSFLLSRGADPNLFVSFEIIVEAIRYGYYDVVTQFIKYDFNVTKQDADGWSLLHSAASYNHLAIVRLLLENGAGILIESPNAIGHTPLSLVTGNNRREIVALLESYKKQKMS